MPELPEVEVSRLGIKPYAQDKIVTKIEIRQAQLRWKIPNSLYDIEGQKITAVKRRAKYLILETEIGNAIIHLGMSGSLRVLSHPSAPSKHDHVDLHLQSGVMIRYNDPRRFGAWLWQPIGEKLAILDRLGPEPFSDTFNCDYFYQKSQKRRINVKQFIMDNSVVVGVGNIYANEALFLSQIHPNRQVNTLTVNEIQLLVNTIKEVLNKAIQQGGTTLKDFTQTDGKPGYFAQNLLVYGRQEKPCLVCQTLLQSIKLGQRNTVFCPNCQK